MKPITYRFDPNNEAARAFEGLWSYRRIVDRTLYEPGHVESDVCVINWVVLDHIGGDLVTADASRRAVLVEAARDQTRSLVYWLQTEAERPDGGQGWPGLRLRGDIDVEPAQVAATGGLLTDFQRGLVARGVELQWPATLELEEGDPHAHAR